MTSHLCILISGISHCIVFFAGGAGWHLDRFLPTRQLKPASQGLMCCGRQCHCTFPPTPGTWSWISYLLAINQHNCPRQFPTGCRTQRRSEVPMQSKPTRRFPSMGFSGCPDLARPNCVHLWWVDTVDGNGGICTGRWKS